METIAIYGSNYLGHSQRTRKASRGILLREGKILLTHETAIWQWMIPGGGVEDGETMEECCIREMAEETGVLVRPEDCCLAICEYYEDWEFLTHYFLCRAVGTALRRPTKRERLVGAEPQWIPFAEALDIFSAHPAYAQKDEERRGIYLREYTALSHISIGLSQ